MQARRHSAVRARASVPGQGSDGVYRERIGAVAQRGRAVDGRGRASGALFR